MNRYSAAYLIFCLIWTFVFMAASSRIIIGLSLFFMAVNFIFMVLCLGGEDDKNSGSNSRNSN